MKPDEQRYWKSLGDFHKEVAELIKKENKEYSNELQRLNYQIAIVHYERGELIEDALGIAKIIGDREKVRELETKLGGLK
ncbi:MAG: hypothetical protein AABX11_05145 [Nanoarchaeota archaeon]